MSTFTLKFHFENKNYVEEGHLVASGAGILRNIKTSQPNNQIKAMPFVQFINAQIVHNDDVVVEWFGKLELKNKRQTYTIIKLMIYQKERRWMTR